MRETDVMRRIIFNVLALALVILGAVIISYEFSQGKIISLTGFALWLLAFGFYTRKKQ